VAFGIYIAVICWGRDVSSVTLLIGLDDNFLDSLWQVRLLKVFGTGVAGVSNVYSFLTLSHATEPVRLIEFWLLKWARSIG
jgi:hypothetical protein